MKYFDKEKEYLSTDFFKKLCKKFNCTLNNFSIDNLYEKSIIGRKVKVFYHGTIETLNFDKDSHYVMAPFQADSWHLYTVTVLEETECRVRFISYGREFLIYRRKL